MGIYNRVDREANKSKWLKIIEEFQSGGQSQLSFCNQKNIKNSTFAYHLGLWRKDNSFDLSDPTKLSFLPLGNVIGTVYSRTGIICKKPLKNLKIFPHGNIYLIKQIF